jgi:hypothetical protein
MFYYLSDAQKIVLVICMVAAMSLFLIAYTVEFFRYHVDLRKLTNLKGISAMKKLWKKLLITISNSIATFHWNRMCTRLHTACIKYNASVDFEFGGGNATMWFKAQKILDDDGETVAKSNVFGKKVTFASSRREQKQFYSECLGIIKEGHKDVAQIEKGRESSSRLMSIHNAFSRVRPEKKYRTKGWF